MAITKTYSATSSSTVSVSDNDIIVVQQGTGAEQLGEMKKTTIRAVRQPLVDAIAAASMTAGAQNKYISEISQASGVVSVVVSDFDSEINPNGLNAPNSQAVINYVQHKIDSTVASNISSAVNALDVDVVGSTGYYIQSISEADGKINARVQVFNSSVIDDGGNAPSSRAVKNYVEGKLAALDSTVGDATGTTSLISSITQTNGAITGTVIDLDDSITNASTGVPTSSAVYSAFGALNTTQGGAGTLVKSITQANGLVSASTVEIANTIENNANKIPSSKAVYDYNQALIYNALSGLDYENGATGSYVKMVTQQDGQLGAQLQAFDTEITANTGNAPTTNAIKDYVDTASSSLRAAINALDYESSGAAGSFIQKVDQTDGMISETVVTFENNTLASFPANWDGESSNASYANSTVVAPTVRAISEQIARLDDRIHLANVGVEALNATYPYVAGKFIGEVAQTTGQLSASYADFLSSVPSDATSATGVVAPSANAVRSAINNLNYNTAGVDGSYIKTISEASGVVSAGVQTFDTEVTANTGNAPTSKAVKDYVDEAKREILEESEAMTYLGAANCTASMASLSSKASRASSAHKFNVGDVFAANGDFNLDGSTGITGPVAYQVYEGDMVFVNTDCDEINAATYKNFDIIGGSDKTVLFDDTTSTTGHFPMFKDDKGRLVEDSGVGVAELTDIVAEYASEAASWAANASSSAIFASSQAQPYVDEASEAAAAASSDATWAASTAEYSASQAGYSASQAGYSASQAGYSASQATWAASKATYANTQAVDAASKATYANTQAVDAASKATYTNTQAVDAASKAGYADIKARNAASSATVADNNTQAILGFYSDAELAWGNIMSTFEPQAKENASYVASYAIAASTNASYTASSANFAASKANTASLAAQNTVYNEGISSDAALAAASFAEAANLENIRYTASMAAIYASSSAEYAATGFLDKLTTNIQQVNGQVNFAQTIQAVDFIANSSRKCKENIKPTTISALDLIDGVEIVDFNYIADDEKTPHIGFIAEDTDSILSTPHLNKMDYTNCIGTLFKAVQEITKGIADLERKVEDLKKQ